MKFYVLWLVDKPANAHKTIFALNNIYYFFFKPS
jgi:hypothetical protein